MTRTDGDRAPRWLRLLLLGSLAANLLFVGLLAGAWIGQETEEDPKERLPFLLRVVPESWHDEARAMMVEDRAGSTVRDEERGRAQARALEALRAEPFDAARLEAALADWAEHSMARRTATRGQLVRLASRMEPADRAAMANRLEEVIERWRARRERRRAAVAKAAD